MAINLGKFQHWWTGTYSSILKAYDSEGSDPELWLKAQNIFLNT